MIFGKTQQEVGCNDVENTFYIYDRAFSNCEKLESLAFSKSLKFVEQGNFEGVDNLKYIYYGGSVVDRKKIDLSLINKEFLNSLIWHYNIEYDKYYEDEFNSIKHNLGTWEITKKPTCTQKGERIRYCIDDDCAYNEADKIVAAGHKYSSFIITKKSTCTTDGEREKECEVCKDKITEVVKTAGHAFGEWEITKEPTCAKIDKMERTCTVCGAKKEEDAAPKISHTFDDYVIIKQVTATTDGVIQGKCKICGKTIKQTVAFYSDDKSSTKEMQIIDEIEIDTGKEFSSWKIWLIVIAASVAIGTVVAVLIFTKPKKKV